MCLTLCTVRYFSRSLTFINNENKFGGQKYYDCTCNGHSQRSPVEDEQPARRVLLQGEVARHQDHCVPGEDEVPAVHLTGAVKKMAVLTNSNVDRFGHKCNSCRAKEIHYDKTDKLINFTRHVLTCS